MSGRRVIRRGQQSTSSLPTAREKSEVERLKQSEVALKSRVRMLEVEVDTLKYRLDGLRKAKNTTIVRREREEIKVSSPKFGRHRSCTSTPHLPPTPPPPPNSCHDNKTSLITTIDELKVQIDKLSSELLSQQTKHDRLVQEMKDSHEEEVNSIKRRSEEDVARLQSQVELLQKESTKDSLKSQQCDALLEELEKLKRENSDLTDKMEKLLLANEQLRDSHLLLEGKCETLLEDLSIKEACWTQREEELKAEVQKKWGERYQEWITKAEKKMEELQQVNALLQSMMKSKQGST